MYFYQRLKDIREDSEKSQQEIANVLQITQQQYQLYESGKREIKVHQLLILARYYNVSLDYLAGLINTPRTLDGTPYQINRSKTMNIHNAGFGNKFTIK